MKPKRILIIEDDQEISNYLKFLIKKLSYIVAGVVTNYEDAIEKIGSLEPDLLLVDIKLHGNKTGVDLAQEASKVFKAPIIFITSVPVNEVIENIRLENVQGYLSKPFKEDDLFAAIELAMDKLSSKSDNYMSDQSVFVKHKSGFVRIHKGEIKYFEADGSYTNIYTSQKYVIRKNLKEVAETIDSNLFFRTHRSYLVNMNFVNGINYNSINLAGEELPINKKTYSILKERFNVI